MNVYIREKREIWSYTVLITVSIIALSIFSFTKEVLIHLIAIWSICIASMRLVKFNVTHPFVWFSFALTLYSTSYAMLYYLGEMDRGYSAQNLILPSIALVVSLLIIGPKQYQTKPSSGRVNDRVNLNTKLFCMLFLVITVICDIMLFSSGLLTKSVLKAAKSIPYRIGVYSVRYFTMFMTLRLCYLFSIGKDMKLSKILLLGVPVIIFGLFTGERDVYIRYFVVIVLCLFYYGKLNRKHIFIMAPIFVLLLTMSVVVKYLFSKGVLNDTATESSLFVQFLRSDFSAAGRNLQYLLDRPWTQGSQGWGMLFTEFISPFLPSGMVFSPDKWFNYEVHNGTSTGNAFTLVGTGYIIAGIAGIVVVFIIVGLIVRVSFRRAKKNIYTMATYLYMTTCIMFSFRQSLSTIISALLKTVLVCYLLCKYTRITIRKNNMRRVEIIEK